MQPKALFRFIVSLFVVSLFLGAMGQQAIGQTTGGSLRGTVKDSTGSIVPPRL